MAWTTTVDLDADKADVGIATAKWEDDSAGEFFPPALPFVYTRRAQINVADRLAFRSEAITRRDAERTRRQQNASLAANLESFMNQ